MSASFLFQKNGIIHIMSITANNGPKPAKRVSAVWSAMNASRRCSSDGTKVGSTISAVLKFLGTEKYDTKNLWNRLMLRNCGDTCPEMISTLSVPRTGYKTFLPETTFSTKG